MTAHPIIARRINGMEEKPVTRSVKEIAADVKAAAEAIGKTGAEAARAMTGSTPTGGTPKVEVRLDDGRVVELGALADELIAAAEVA